MQAACAIRRVKHMLTPPSSHILRGVRAHPFSPVAYWSSCDVPFCWRVPTPHVLRESWHVESFLTCFGFLPFVLLALKLCTTKFWLWTHKAEMVFRSLTIVIFIFHLFSFFLLEQLFLQKIRTQFVSPPSWEMRLGRRSCRASDDFLRSCSLQKKAN